MCGIAGFLSFNRAPVDPGVLEGMINMIRHRGPDGCGIYIEGPLGLAHARLSIIDLSGGRQPMHYRECSLSITFNGEIFNYRELRDSLCARGHRFVTQSDTEVVLHLYAEYGEGCVQYLNGEWAFAIWDARRRTLFASRDRVGVRPFFYAVTDDALVFASELKAICAYPGFRRELDLVALDQIFTFWVTLPPRTILKGVQELPPAHTLTASEGRVCISPYWRLEYTPDYDAIECEEKRAAELRELLLDSTRLRLRSDVPVATYLSGGLDSTIVTALARKAADSRLTTFSITFDQSHLDESNYQRDAIDFLHTDHQELHCSPGDIARVFPDVMWHTEKPVLRTAPAPLYLLSKLVRDNGYKVVVTGEGADEILGGYDIFKETKIRRFLSAQPHSQYRSRLLRRLYPYLPGLQKQPDAYLRHSFGVDPGDRDHPFFSHQPRWQLTASLKAFFSPQVTEALRDCDAYTVMAEDVPAGYEEWDQFSRAQYLETAYLLPGYILSSQGDRVAMANSVEARHPYLDHRLIDFAAKLPPQLKMKVLCEKYLLKRACADLVPPSVLRRPKQPFRSPDGSAFIVDGADYARDLLSAACLERDGIFNARAVERLVDKFVEGRSTSVRDDMALVGILSTQLVIHHFLHAFSPVRSVTNSSIHLKEAFNAVG
jgi:asparagine synthase (glutamine-hydrolysing)